MLDVKDGFGKPVRRTGSQGYPNTGEGRDHRVFTTHAMFPSRGGPSGSLPLSDSSYIHGEHRATWTQQSCMTGAESLKVLLFASQTGCGQRTPERPPSSRAALRCARSAGRKERCQAGGGRWVRAPGVGPDPGGMQATVRHNTKAPHGGGPRSRGSLRPQTAPGGTVP